MNPLAIRLAGTAAMLRYKLARLRRRPVLKIRDVADRVDTIEPAGRTVAALRPIVAERHLANIRSGFDGATREKVLADIAKTEHGLGPVEALTLRDAFLLCDAVVTQRTVHSLHRQSGQLSFWRGSEVASVDRAGVAGTYAGSRWFGHLLHDEFPAQLELEKLAPPVLHHRPFYAHEPGYREVLQLATPPRYRALRAAELVMLSDVPQSASKTRRYRVLRDRVAAAFPPAARAKRVFLLRRTSGSRRCLVNEEEVMTRLAREGFEAVDANALDARGVLGAIAGAGVVCGVEGSQMVPAFLAAAPNALMVVINPPTRTTSTLPEIGAFFGLNAAIVVAEPAGGEDFRQDPEDLVAAIDEALAVVARDPRRAEAFIERVLAQ